VFDQLTEKLDGVFKKLRGQGKLTEANVEEALREVRRALLEADVNYKVARRRATRWRIASPVSIPEPTTTW
jgi:signal recognition particle subunit SRP54